MKNKYDTSAVFLYAMGKENLLVDFRRKIPYSLFPHGEKRTIATISVMNSAIILTMHLHHSNYKMKISD